MSVKKLINALFKLSGGQAMPNKQSNVITHSFSTSTSFVAPSDGYVCLRVEDPSTSWYRLSLITNSMEYLFNNDAGAHFGSGWFAVKKGTTIESILNSGISGSIKFISSVGGGAKSLLSQAVRCVRGGGLCLKTSLKHSLKPSLRTRKNGFRLSQNPVGNRRIQFRALMSGINTLLRQTAFSPFTGITSHPSICSVYILNKIGRERQPVGLLICIFLQRFQSKKAIRFSLCTSEQLRNFTSALAATNLTVGGVA